MIPQVGRHEDDDDAASSVAPGRVTFRSVGGADIEKLGPVMNLHPFSAVRLTLHDFRAIDLLPPGPVDDVHGTGSVVEVMSQSCSSTCVSP